MKRILLLVLIVPFIFIFGGCNPKPDPVDKEIHVMTFNVRTLGAEPAPERNWDNRKELVLETVLLSSPDIIGFQELKKAQYDYFIENLSEYEHYGVNGWGDTPLANMFGGYNAIFYKKDRFVLRSSATLWLSDTPDTPSPCFETDTPEFRTIGKVELEDKLNNKITTVIDTHLPYKGEETMRKSTELLKQVAGEVEGRLIVMGDFNYQQDTPHYVTVTSGNLKDCKKLAASFEEGGSFHSFGGHIDKPWPLPIDFILINDAYFTVKSHKINRHHNEAGHYPSDHYPVEVVLEYV